MTLAMKIDEERDIAELKKSVSAVRKGRNKGTDAFLKEILSLNEELDAYPERSDLEIAKEIFLG